MVAGFRPKPDYVRFPIWQTAMPVIEKLDPMEAYIPFKLFRESTRYYKKALVKVLPG